MGLDVGCGTGNYTIPFAKHFSELLGLDASREMLAEARRTEPSIRWIEGDARAPAIESSSIDRIWCISTAHYLKGDGQTLFFQEMLRLLRPNGRLVVDVEFEEQHPSMWQTYFFPSLKERYAGALFSRAWYQTKLSNIGFSKVEFETAEIDDDVDGAVRIGQRRPELYLDVKVLSKIPAFRKMKDDECEQGVSKLRKAIHDKSIEGIIDEHSRAALLKGDYGFVIAIK